MRIGHGYDAHRYGTGEKFVIGGVEIPCEFGMIAHSDGDVLAHAVMDALLGAAGLDDIGHQFPDTEEKFKGISSMELLKTVSTLVKRANFRIEYIDCTIIAQVPKMSPYLEEMKINIARYASLKPRQINIKATTEENMGFTGAKEGIAAHAVCLLDELGHVSSF